MENLNNNLRLKNEYYDRMKVNQPIKPKVVASKKQLSMQYLLLAMVLIVTACAKLGNLVPCIVSIGVLVGLSYTKFNLSILAPISLICNTIVSPTLPTIVLSASFIIVLIIAYIAHSYAKKPINFVELVILSALASVPIIWCYPDLSLLGFALNFAIVVATQFVTVFSVIAVRKKRFSKPYTTDECVALVLFALLFSLGLYNINFIGVYPFFIFASFILLLSLELWGYSAAITLAVALGLGGTSVGLTVALVLSILASSVFVRTGRILPAITFCIVFFASSVYLEFMDIDQYVAYIFIAFGAMVFCLIPKKQLSPFAMKSHRLENKTATLVNNTRFDLSRRLKKVSNAFLGMSKTIKNTITHTQNAEQALLEIASIMTSQLCSGCVLRDDCFRTVGDTARLFMPLVSGAISNGEATILDIDSHLAEHCHKVQEALDMATSLSQRYSPKEGELDIKNSSKLLISEQALEVSSLMDCLAEQLNSPLVYDKKSEVKLADALLGAGIVCEDIAVSGGKKNDLTAHITLKSYEKNARLLPELCSRALGQKMVLKTENPPLFNGLVCLELITAPSFEIAYAERHAVKPGSSVSGDTKCIKKLGDDKVLVIVSDGMGSGEKAQRFSENAIAMIESFYEAGFDDTSTLVMCNKLLAMSREECYSAMDICLINRRTGVADFIKLGTPTTYLVRGNEITTIENESLPIGIIDDMKTTSRSIALARKDILLFVSDGVQDSLGAEAIRRILTIGKIRGVETIAEQLAKELAPYQCDDATALVLKML